MAYIGKVSPDGGNEAVTKMYRRQQDHYGYIPNYAKVFSHRPETLARWGRLLSEIRRPIDDRLFELATFVTAIELNNTGCAVVHGAKLAKWIGKASVAKIAKGDIPENLTAADIAVVNYARSVSRDASGVSQSDIDELSAAGFSDAQIFDIALTISGRAFLSTLMDSLGVLLDSPLQELDENFRKALTVGRPIGKEPVELMA